MTYAALADLEARYPGELAQAGPRDAAGDLDLAAIEAALSAAGARVDRALRTVGWPVPLDPPTPPWVVDLTVDLALYLATPTVLASQGDFADRRQRYRDAERTLEAIAAGELLPPLAAGQTRETYFTARPRLFGRGSGLL